MADLLSYHREGECLWITLSTAGTELETAPQMPPLRQEVEGEQVRRIVVDLGQLPYFGSTVLEFLVLLWRRVGRRDGRLVLYRPSPIGREVLSAARLDQLWPVAETRDEALRLASEEGAG